MPVDGILVNDRLSTALAGRLALQMSLSSLPMVEEWMDAPLTRWLDSVPLPPEMPGGYGPPLVVSLGADALMVRWAAAGAPAGVVPKLVDYMRRAGAVPADFSQVDAIGQGLEPAVVGSWVEARPGAVTTGWFVADRMDPVGVRDLLGEGAWLEQLGGGILRVGRSIGPDPTTDVVVELPGEERNEQLAAAAAAFARCGLAFDQEAAARLAGIEIALGARARAGQVVSARLMVVRPGPTAAGETCGALGLTLAPAVQMVERSIGASEVAMIELERSEDGAAVALEYVAGSARTNAN
ncbi:MAG TPA: hypothetical protein VK698_33905 [Kofleriaceae bacterium]|nr:hypothetical protein [Kofleriaceae bacterium]